MGRGKDPVWKYAEELQNGRWRCIFCEEIFRGNSTRIKAHLGGIKNRGVKECLKVDEDTRRQVENALLLSKDTNSMDRCSDRMSDQDSVHLFKRARSGDSPAHGSDINLPGTSSNNIGALDTGSGGLTPTSSAAGLFDDVQVIWPVEFEEMLNSLEFLPQIPNDDNNYNSNNIGINTPAHDGVDSSSSKPYYGKADPAPSQKQPGNDHARNTSPQFSTSGPGFSPFQHDSLGAPASTTHPSGIGSERTMNSSHDEVKSIPDDDNGDDGNNQDENSDGDICPVDDPQSLADTYCGSRHKRLEVLQILKRGDTLVLSGGVEGFNSLSSLSPPPQQDVKKLVIDGCPKLKSLLGHGPICASKLQSLTEIVVKDCLEFDGIIAETSKHSDFLRLESVHISACPSLRILFASNSIPHLQKLITVLVQNCHAIASILPHSQLWPVGFRFARLRSLEVVGCPNIITLIPANSLHALNSIQNIKVVDCERLQEIVGEDHDKGGKKASMSICNTGITTLWQLRKLTLKDLPELKSIGEIEGRLKAVLLRLVAISNCPKMKRVQLLEGLTSPQPSLRLIFDKEQWESLECPDHITKTRLHRYLKLSN